MSIKDIRETLQRYGIPGASDATMRYGAYGVQVYSVGGIEIERPAGEAASVSEAELVRELTKP